jgi:hypothetical protein
LARVQFPSVKEESTVFQGAVYPEWAETRWNHEPKTPEGATSKTQFDWSSNQISSCAVITASLHVIAIGSFNRLTMKIQVQPSRRFGWK